MKLFLLVLCTILTTRGIHGRTLVLAHRGNPCRFPEEMRKSFESAIEKRVDYIEMDVVATKDGVLVTRHDLTLDTSTNVNEMFKERNPTTKKVQGQNVTGHFAIDFDLSELAELKTRQSLSFRDQDENDQYNITTLEEVLRLIKKKRKEGYPTGAYIETKEPEFHEEHGQPLEETLVDLLEKYDLLHAPRGVYLQSFSMKSLRLLHALVKEKQASVPMTWLLNCSDKPTDKELKEFGKIGTAIGLSKSMLVKMKLNTPECNRGNATCDDLVPNQKCSGRLIRNADNSVALEKIIGRVKDAGLDIHVYTFRNEDQYMPLDFVADPTLELEFYTNRKNGLKVDGVFVDCPETAIRVLGTAPPLPAPGLAFYWVVLIFLAVVVGIIGGFATIYLYRKTVGPYVPGRLYFMQLWERCECCGEDDDDDIDGNQCTPICCFLPRWLFWPNWFKRCFSSTRQHRKLSKAEMNGDYFFQKNHASYE